MKNINGEKTGKKQLLDVLKEMKKYWNFNPYPTNVENRVSS